ncbi:MAG: glycosyltransferase family 4 protein [Chloroflexota bacterium]
MSLHKTESHNTTLPDVVRLGGHDLERLDTRAPAQRPLRVLQATARYFPFTGGVETHVYEVARRLAERGMDVTVLSTDPTGKLPTNEQQDGVNVVRVRAWPNKEDLYMAPGLYDVIVNGGWDVVHCQGIHTLAAPLIMYAAWKAKIPFVVTFHTGGHSSPLRHAIRGIQWQILRPLLARADRLIGVSRFEADLFRTRLHLPGKKFRVIPNGSNLPRPEQPLPASGEEDTLIVSVGRLERYKGHQRVIAALPHLLEQRPDARLRIIGSGPYEDALRTQVQQLGLTDRVEIGAIASTDRGAMASAVSRASLAVLLSDYEAHPIAVMEALSLGVPMLVADTSGLSEIAEQGLATAIPLNSTPIQIAQAINEQLQNPAALHSLELPTWDACVSKLSAVYNAVARRSACVS